jgi:hypothetical protein
MIALRADDDIDDRRAAHDLVALGLRDAAGDAMRMSRPSRRRRLLGSRRRPSSE